MICTSNPYLNMQAVYTTEVLQASEEQKREELLAA
jgi:hypothetical protein